MKAIPSLSLRFKRYTLKSPQQIVVEDEVTIAQSLYGQGLLRIVYAEVGDTLRIVTLYWTNQVRRYWQKESNES